MAEGTTTQAASYGLRATEQLAVALVDQRTGIAGPNKPMVATAHTQRDEYALSAGRRHIGQPFYATSPRTACNGITHLAQSRSKDRATGSVLQAVYNELRFIDNGPRTMDNERRAA